MNLSDIILKNGSASLRDLYPLSKVHTAADKAALASHGYAPGYTDTEWPYDLPVVRIFYSNALFPATYYFDNRSPLPILINLHIIGTQRLALDNSDLKEIVEKINSRLYKPTLDDVESYLLGLEDGYRAEVLETFIQNTPASPELFDLFLSYYTISDYGAGKYSSATLRKLASGRSEAQKEAIASALVSVPPLESDPDILLIYRGEAEGSTPYTKAYSWSLNINAAFFFACRYGDHCHARIIRGTVRKDKVIAARLDSQEMEVIVLPEDVKGIDGSSRKPRIEKLIGPDSPAVMPPKYINYYAMGREQIRRLYKSREKAKVENRRMDHDMVHSARVLFLALAIVQAGKIELSPPELLMLEQAIVYHDIGRITSDGNIIDGVDCQHGKASRNIYEKKCGKSPTVGFLIEYHCVDDSTAKAALTLSMQSGNIHEHDRTWLLYQIMKDADALDRVRFGIYALDVNYLRLPISHKLVPLAVSALRGIEV